MGDISDFTFGVWFVEEEDLQIDGNTPGGITYTNLVEGDTYIYLDTIIKFEHRLGSEKEGTDFLGFDTMQIGTRKIQANAYGGIRGLISITAMVTEDIGEKLKTLYYKHVAIGDGNKYLLHQRAATTFEQFPDDTAALKKYAEVIIRAMHFTETNDGGKDKKLVVILCEQVAQRT